MLLASGTILLALGGVVTVDGDSLRSSLGEPSRGRGADTTCRPGLQVTGGVRRGPRFSCLERKRSELMASISRKEIRLTPPDHRACGALVGLLCAGLYLRTLAPTALWYDMAEMAAAAHHLGIAHNTGYPLYVLLGKLFTFLPVGDIAYRVHLMSAAFAAGTVMVVFFIVWDLTRCRIAACLSSLTLGVSSTLWANATLAESYDLNAFLTASLTYLMLKWQRTGRRGPLLGAFCLLGLGMGNHHLIQFFGPAMVAYWLMVNRRGERRSPWLDVGLSFALFLVGFAINLYLPIRAAQKPVMMWADASDWQTFLRMITVGMPTRTSVLPPAAGLDLVLFRLRMAVLFPLNEFTIAGPALALFGTAGLWRRNRSFLVHTLVGSGLTLAMVLVYSIHNVFQYFLPIYVMAAIWIGQGIASLMGSASRWQRARWGRSRMRVSPEGVQLLMAALLLGLPVYLAAREFAVLDRSQDYSAYDFANYLHGRLENDAVVVGDFWAWAPLYYYQSVAGWRPDVGLGPLLSTREVGLEQLVLELTTREVPVYLASGRRVPEELSDAVTLHPAGIGVIETMTVPGLPLPRYKDVWLPMENLWRVLDRPADLSVAAVPEEHELPEQRRFGQDLALVGFGGPSRPVRVGDAAPLTYYWVLEQPTSVDYFVSVQFEDAEGYVHLVQGFPAWDHSHVLGGSSPTSGWAPEVIVREVYDTLVPWRVAPGEYTVKAWVYQGEERTHPVPAINVRRPEEGVSLGRITVLPRR
jgi:hypothetical protein